MNSSMFDLTGRVAVVTGGASGLGGAITRGLSAAGAVVAVLDRDAETAAQLLGELPKGSFPAASYTADVTDSRSVQEAADAIAAAHGPAEILVNCAGVAHRSPAEDFPEEEFDRVIAINLKGTFLTCQAFGRQMLENGRGSIINVASTGGFIAYPLAAAYLASKGGVIQLTRSLALEWTPRNVRVNAIAPTLFDTPLTQGTRRTNTLTNEYIEERSLRGSEPITTPEDVVGAVIFLASDASPRVVGHTLPVDDGYLIV
jgi:NAD(P)-dependent dehydrogenase (short-subunit alcohol dehydrogenase family)